MHQEIPYSCEYWSIEINTLKELLELCKTTENPIIVTNEDLCQPDKPCLEIYDAYRD